MKKMFFLLLISINLLIQAQEKPIIISGQVSVDAIPLSEIHIINKILDLGTISDDNGTISSGIIQLYKKDKYLTLTTVLLESSKTFSSTNLEEKTTLTQN